MPTALNVNGLPVLEGDITMPRVGAWTATLSVDSTVALSGVVAVTSGDGALSLVGRVVRGDVFADRVTVMLVAGTGDLKTPLAARGYQSIPARIVVSAILAEAGFALSPTSTGIDTILPHWTQLADTAERCLGALLEKLELTWRVLADGTVWCGTDAYPAASDDLAVVLDRDDAHGFAVLGVDMPRLMPATTYDGKRVELVVHTVRDGIRTKLYFAADGIDGGDRVRGMLARLVKKSLPSLDFRAAYRARVVVQKGATLDLMPEADDLPPLMGVPIRYGLPGISAQVLPGSTVLVFFDDGDPARPRAALFDAGGLLSVTVTVALMAKLTAPAVEITAPSIQLGGPAAMPLAHAPDIVAALTAISTALGALGAAAASVASVGGPLTHAEYGAQVGALQSLPAAIGAMTPGIPSLTTRAM
jgi:hypothetical protein